MLQKIHNCQIPFHQPYFDEMDIQAVVETLRSGWVTTGPAVEAFEKAFCEYVGAPYAVAVNSCTAAMHLALAGLGIGANDLVITTPYTFVATAEAVQYLGAQPVFVDIREEDFNIDPNLIERAVVRSKDKVKAILPVHVAGQPCRMDAIVDIAQRFDLRIVEDAAHALEAEIEWRPSAGEKATNTWRKVGTIGDATCFSFYATKNITTGEGGMVTTHNTKLAERIRCLALHGLSRDAWKRYSAEGDWYYEIVEQGYKYNMPDILAALGLSQLQRVKPMHQTRCRLVGIYEKELQDIPEVILPRTHGNVKHAWHLYIMRLQTNLLTITRNEFVAKLKEAGIGTSVHFIPLHLHPYYQRRFGCTPGDYPVAERLYRSAISLPLYPKLTEEQVHFVAAKVKQLIKENSKQTKFKGVDPRTFHSANFSEKAS